MLALPKLSTKQWNFMYENNDYGDRCNSLSLTILESLATERCQANPFKDIFVCKNVQSIVYLFVGA